MKSYKVNHYLILFFCTLSMSACSSSFKKNCDSTNWYERGKKIAESGDFLDSDNYVKRCEAAGVNISYQQLDRGFKFMREKKCQPDLGQQLGQAGKTYDFPLCENYNAVTMKNAYNKGLRKYCSPTNAKIAGAKGEEYLNVCPKNVEKEFLAAYNQAKQTFVSKSIRKKESKLNQIDQQISQLKDKQNGLKKKLQQAIIHGNDGGRISLQDQINTIKYQILDLQSNSNTIKSEITELKAITSK